MAQISLRIDDDVKRAAELVSEDIGITMSAAINIYLKKMGREKRIPFELTAGIRGTPCDRGRSPLENNPVDCFQFTPLRSS